MPCCCSHHLCRVCQLKGSENPERVNVGAHIALGNDIVQTYKQCDLNVCQVYLGSRQSYNARTITLQQQEELRNMCEQRQSRLYVHAPLSCNLGRDPEHDIARNTRGVLDHELSSMKNVPGGVVVHIGSVGSLDAVAANIDLLNFDSNLLIEISAGQGTQLGRSTEEIRKLYEALDYSRVALCVDTQHAFGSGMCSFDSAVDTINLMENLYDIGCAVPMIHLNDSKVEFNCKKDRHESLSRGHIWHNSTDSLHMLGHYSADYGIDLILETPDPLADLRFMDQLTRDIS